MNKASFPGIKTGRDEGPELQQDPRGPGTMAPMVESFNAAITASAGPSN